MIVDLHSHYPMHLAAGERAALAAMLSRERASLRDRLRATVLRIACRLANYQGPGGGPAVTLDTLRASKVRVALSVLYAPLDEMDLGLPYGAPPRAGYFRDVLELLEQVEQSVAGRGDVAVARDPGELEAALAAGKVALVHCVEAGLLLGDTPERIRINVQALAERGVAYITVAHLFWRGVASNVPALPFLPDWVYDLVFPQPRTGLTALGRALVEAMVEHGILVDVTHMSPASLQDTLALLDRLDPQATVPVLASHGATRPGPRYNLTDAQIGQIAQRGGVVGLLACPHYLAGRSKPASFEDSVRVVCRHVDHMHAVTGSHRFTALGSDQDGFIKPTLPGLETPVGLGALEDELARHYGAAISEMICSGNARRVLACWGRTAALT